MSYTKSLRNGRRLIAFSFFLGALLALITGSLVRSSLEGSSSRLRSDVLSTSLLRRSDWPLHHGSKYCEALLRDPSPLDLRCHFNPELDRCSNRSIPPVMFSQYHQDFYLFKHHFMHLKRPGVYADIATNHPYHISNTYFFDHCLNWGGLCVEANYLYFENIYRYRSCKLVPTCVSSRDNVKIDFALRGGLGGILDKSYKSMKRFNSSTMSQTYSTRCMTMSKVNGIYGLSEIDYLSLDVEGHELDVLKGFSLDNFIIKVMTIEGTYLSLRRIEQYLSSYGYKRHYPHDQEKRRDKLLLREDAVFLHNSVTFGKPV